MKETYGKCLGLDAQELPCVGELVSYSLFMFVCNECIMKYYYSTTNRREER